jgi:hypothetical protein
MRTCLVAIAALFTVSTIAYGQDVSGKWQTPTSSTAPPVVFDLKLDGDNKISGTVTENKDSFPIIEGTVTGRTFTFKTTREINRVTLVVTWNGRMMDDNTLRVIRGPGVALRGDGAPSPQPPPRTPPPPPPPPPGQPDVPGALTLHRVK